ncbi:MAG: hypothetical protein NVS3B29_00570 [Candidatus Saccharimonadales bacterium]
MSAVLHFESADRPVAGASTDIWMIDLKHSAKFSPADCDCRLVISLDSQPLASLKMSPQPRGLKTAYTFPAVGTYQLHFTGRSHGADDMTRFDIAYTERIDHIVPIKASPAAAMIYILVGATVAILMVLGLRAGLKAKA